MATGNTNITINFNIGGDFSEKIDKYVRKINTAQKVVTALRDSLESLASSGAKGFDSANITKSLESVKNVFSSFKNIKGDDLRKSIEALDPTRLREFSGALTGFQGALTNDLVGRVNSFAASLQGLSVAQKAMDSGTFVEKLNAISEALPRLQSAVKSENFKTFAGSLSGLNVDAQNIQGIIKLGQALKSITEFGNKGTSLNELATGIKSLGRIRETSGFTRNVENIVKAGALLAKMEPIDFSKITGGLSQLTTVNLKKEEWDKVKEVAGKIKEAFADLKSVKIPNLLGFQMGVEALNNGMAMLDDPRGLKANVAEIKLALDQLSKVKMPNLGNLVKNLGKLSEENYDFDKIGKSVQSFKNTLGQLHGIQIPSLSGFAKGLVELKGVSGAEVQNIANALKGVPESLTGWDKVKTPNLTNFAKGLKELGSGTIDFKQVNENLKSLPNRLKKLGEIQAPDLSKFAKGLVDLSQPAVSAVKSAHAIDKALEVLTKYSGTQIKLPSLSNFAKGLRELSTFEGELTTLQGKSTLIKNFISGFSDLDKIKLPNIQGVATAIHKLSTAVPDNAGTLAAGHIGAIVENVKKLDNVKLPNIRQIGQAVTELAAISNHKYGTAEGGLIRLVNRIKELDSVKLPNIRQIGQTMTELAAISSHKYGVAEGGLIQLVNRIKDLNNIKIANIRQIGQTMTELAAISSHKYGVAEGGLIQMVNRLKDLNDIKLPNIRQIGQTLTELAAISSHKYGVAEGGLIQLIARLKELDGVHLTNVRQIGQSMTELSKISNHKYGTVESGLIGFVTRIKELDKVKIPNVRQIGQALTELAEISNKHKFHKINTNISGFIAELKKLDSVKLPNIRQIGQTMTELAAISSHKYGVAEGGLIQLITRLKELSSINIPNIRQVGKTMTELAAISSHKYGVAESGLIGFVTRIKELDKVNIPNVRQIGQALTELNAVASKHKFNTLNAQLPKFITEISRLHSIQLPNVKQIGQGVAELAKLSNHKFGTVEQGLIKVIDRLKDLNGVQLPNVKQIGQALQMFNEYSSNATIAASKLGILRTELGQWTNIKLPNVKNVAEGLKTLNDTTIKYKFDSNAKYVSQIKVVADEIKTAFAGFNNIQLPNVKNVADGFKTLNSIGEGSTTKETYQKLSSNMRLLKAALEQIKDFGNVSFPNIKNIAQGMKDLRSLGDMGQELSTKFETVKKALEKIQGISVPNLKTFAEGFRELKKIIDESSKGTGNLNTEKFAKELTALSTALGSFGKVSLPTNLSGFAKGIDAITKVNIDGFSAKFQRLIQEIDKFKIDPNKTMIDAFNAKLAMAANCIAQIDSRMQQSQQQFGSFGRAVEQTITPLDKFSERVKMFLQYRVISNVFNNLTNWLQSIPEQIREFEKAMYNVQSITGATNSTIAQLGLTVKDIASTTKFSAAEVADGMTMIAQAGFSAGQSMQMMQSISNLATGTLTDMKTTVDLVTSAMVVFNIEAHNSSRVSDVFANAVNKSKLTMDKIKTAFNYIGPVARDAGVSFEETAVSMMLLANSGQKASTIGTGLRNVFSTLLSPSKKLTEAANAAGVALVDLDPRVNSMKTVIENLSLVVRDSSVALDVFGKRGSTAVLSLTNGLKDYDRLINSVQRVGSAADMASKQQEGLYVRWKNMHDRAQLVAVTLGENGLTGALGALIDKFSSLLNAINQANESMGGRILIKATMLGTTFATFGVTLAGIIKYFPMLWSGIKAGNVALATMATRLIGVKAASDAAGASMKALTALSMNLGILAAFTALSLAISYAVEKTKELENAIKDAAVEIGRIKGQISAFDDASEIFNRAQAGTEEYANAIRTVMAAFEENKGAVKGAEDEYTALKESIDAVNGRFRDGGEALQRYGEKLKQLEIEKISQQLSNLYKQFDKVQNKVSMFTEEGKDRGMRVVDVREWDAGEVSGVEVVRATDYAKSMELLEQIRAKAVDIKEIFQSNWFGNSAEQNFAEWRDGLQQLTEGAINLLDVLHKAGKIDFTMPEESIRKLLIALGKTRDEIEATMYNFKQMQKAEFDGMFMKAIGPSLAGDLRKVAGEAANVNKLYKQIGETVDATGKTSVNLSNAFASVKDNVERAAAELQKVSVNVNITEEDKQAVANILNSYLELYNELEAAKEQHEAKIRAIEERNDLSDHQKILHRKEAEAELNDVRERFAERASALLKERNANENVAMLYRASIYNAEVREAVLAEEKKIDAARKRCAEILGIQEQELKDRNSKELASIKEWTDTQKQALDTWERSLTEHEKRMAALAERMSKKMNDALRSPESAEAFTTERLKAFKIIEKRADSSLQHELNNIRKLEELYIQTNGKLGVTFKEARQMEQNAVQKTYQELNAALSGYIDELKKKYPNSYREVIQPIQDKIVEITAKSEETQINLKDKNIKKEMALRGAAAKQIENISKEMHAAIKREQEKAMHDIAVLEAKGVMTHEQAEQSKAEASIKYLQASIRAAEEQYKALSQDPQMVAENAQMLQQLVKDIEKNQEEITKIRRKGIEDQTKIITEGHKKLAEIEGKMGAGAFSAKEQAKITANYEKEFEKRKRLGEENAKALAEAETRPLDKVTQEVQKHAAKRMEIQSKTTEKIASLEKELAQKQEDFERKKLDIIKKYNAKRRDLQTSLQDKLHNIETSGMSGRKKEKADIDYARTKRSRAMSGMEEAIRSGDSQALDRIAKELESAMGAFENASKPKKYKDEIIGIYDALQSVLDAQEQIEKQEAERKNNQEVDALTKKIQTANDAMEKSLAVENERHTKTMGNLEKEANKIREQIALAEKLRDTYINSMSSDGTVPSTQIPKGGPQSRVPVNPGTFNGQVEALGNIPELDSLIKQLQAVQDISVKSAAAFKESWASAMSDFVNDSANKTELWYKDAQGVAQRLTAEQAEAFRQNTDAWIEANGKVYQSYNDVATGANALAGTALETWKRAFDGASTTATTKAQESADAVTEALIKAAGPAGQVLAQSIGEGATKGGQDAQTAFQNLAPALAQVTKGLGLDISNGIATGAATGVEKAKAVEQQWRWEERDGKMWAVYGQGLADAMSDGVSQAQNVEKAWRTEVLADGRTLYTNLTEAQRQGYADMAAAAKSAASGISTEYETLYVRMTKFGEDHYRRITQEEAKAIANKEANALKENELFVKTTERNLEIFQDMSTKMTIGDWAEKFKAAEAEKEARKTGEVVVATFTSAVGKDGVKIPVKVDKDSATQSAKEATSQVQNVTQSNPASIAVTVDDKDVAKTAKNATDTVSDITKENAATISVTVPANETKEAGAEAKKGVEDAVKNKPIELELKVSQSSIDKVKADCRKLFDDLKKDANTEVTVKAKTEEATRQITSLKAILDDLVKKIYSVTVKANVDAAMSALKNVQRELSAIKDKTVTVTVRTKKEGGSVGASTGGYIEHLIPEYNKGGRVRRPEEPEQYADGGQTFRRLPSRYISRGSGHKDDVPALLMKNEFVHRAAAVKKYGLNFMYKLNNLEIPTSITKMFADGGLVSNAITSIQKFATGGLVKSARRKLEDMFSGSGVNLNVDNLNVVGKLEQAADNYTSPIAVQAINTLAKNVEASISKFSNGGILTSSVLTTTQMSAISAKYNALISEARREGNANIAKALSNEQAGIKKLTSELEITLGNLNTSYNKEVQKLTEAHTKRMSDKKAEYERTMASANESYNKRVSEDNRRYAKEDEDYHTSNAKRDKEYSDANVKRDEEYNKSISQLKKDHEKELADLEKTLKDKREAARKEEEQEAKEEAKAQKSYEKEDKRYAKETADRKKAHEKELADAKKEYEDAQFKYETELESKKQEVDAKKAEIENFKNQMASRKFPANSKKIREASVEEVMEAHIAQTKSENKGDDYIYAIDLGGLVKAEDNKGEPPTDAEIQKLYKAIRPYTETEKRHRDKLTTIANNPPYSRQAREQLEKYNNDLNELTGYNAYKRALKAKELGVSIANIENADKEPSKPRQSKPYREYLNSHYTTDYKQPYAQAQRDLDEFLKADSPKTTYDKRVAELKQAYDEAKKEAEEARAEVMEQRKEHAEQLAETRANRAEELRQAQLEYDEGVKTAKENYNTSYKEQTDAYNTERAEAETAYREDKAAAEKERQESLLDRQNSIAERDKDYKDDVAERKRDYDEYVAENSTSYAEDMAAAKESYQSNVADARSRYGEDVASLKESTKSEVESIKGNMNDSISRAQADMQEDFKSQEDAARQALEEKKDTYSTTKKEAEEALVDSIEHPSTTVAAQESVEKATEKMSEDAVLQKYGMSVEELIRRLSKGLWKFATGGLVPSTATSKPNTDSVLSLLMPNEFVMSAKAVRTFGTDFMNSINNLRLPAFSVGGAVESGSIQGTTRSFKAGEMAVNKTIHALDLTINNTHIGELMGERNVIDRFIGEMQRARMSLGATA